MKPERSLICLSVLIWGFLLTNTFPLRAEEIRKSPEEMLTFALESENNLSFKGIRKFEGYSKDKVYRGKARVFHQAPDKWRLEFLEPELRKGEIFILDGSRYWHSPREKRESFSYRGLRPPMETEDIELFISNYEVEMQGEEEIAGREALVLKCRGKYPGRPTLVLWVDKENFLRLKEKRLSPQGQEIYSAEFEEIDFAGLVSPQHFVPPSDEKMQERRERKEELSLTQARTQLDFDILLPKNLPQGFELDRVRIMRWKGRQAALHLVYTDGLTQVSLFERLWRETRPPSEAKELLFKGKVVLVWEKAHFKILKLKEEEISITVISGIPQQELIDMITSLEKFQPEEEGSGL
ncbi:MAG: hypothetical protein AMS15_03975 [Planctomycetes bacterium DG_23]|nr:MAG: hypothetical protein AMS15_03975 [Planctomycetes bacterium DG_23]